MLVFKSVFEILNSEIPNLEIQNCDCCCCTRVARHACVLILAITDFASRSSTVLSRALSLRTSGGVGARYWQRRRVGHTSTLAHLCDVTREGTGPCRVLTVS